MSSPTGSADVLYRDEFVVVVTGDGSRPPLPWGGDSLQSVYVDARERRAWPMLAQLDVPLAKLPRAYVIRADPTWVDRPRPIAPSRVSVVQLGTC